MEQNWYVIHTYSGFENKVKASIEQKTAALGLADRISKILIPTEEVVELRKGKKRISTRKFFPGYLLIKMEMTDELWYLVKNTPKVTGFVGPGTKPVAISEEEAEDIIKQLETGGDRPRHRVMYVAGESVRIIDGPFTNFSGVVEEVKPDKGRLKVMVSIFGRSTPVDLDFLQVERI
jgi:transcription termination/antitermination protein NusG